MREPGSDSRRSPGARHLVLAAAVSLGLAAQPHDREVAILLSQDLPLYREVVRGAEETLGKQAHVLDLTGPDGADRAVARLVDDPPDAVIAVGARAARTATERLPRVPTVYCTAAADEVPGRSGGNATGVGLEAPVELQLAAFREVVPRLARLAVLYDPSRSRHIVARAAAAARSAGVVLVIERVSAEEDVPTALRRAVRDVDGIWLIPDGTVVSHESFRFVLRIAAERRLPVMVFSESMVRAGGLVGLVPDHAEIGRQAAELVPRVLDRRRRSSPGVEPPRALRLVLNARTAENLGLRIPDELASRTGTHVYR